MNTQVNLPSPTLPSMNLQDVVAHVFASRTITRADQHCFMSMAYATSQISREEKVLVDRVFDALRQGRLRVVD